MLLLQLAKETLERGRACYSDCRTIFFAACRLFNMAVDQRTQLLQHSQTSSNAQTVALGVVAAAACFAATLALTSGSTSSLYTATAPAVQATPVTMRYAVPLLQTQGSQHLTSRPSRATLLAAAQRVVLCSAAQMRPVWGQRTQLPAYAARADSQTEVQYGYEAFPVAQQVQIVSGFRAVHCELSTEPGPSVFSSGPSFRGCLGCLDLCTFDDCWLHCHHPQEEHPADSIRHHV